VPCVREVCRTGHNLAHHFAGADQTLLPRCRAFGMSTAWLTGSEESPVNENSSVEAVFTSRSSGVMRSSPW
jgi:hypothetical protein